jgi:hypothetical protein
MQSCTRANICFPTSLTTRNGTGFRMATHPMRPVPIRPVTPAQATPLGQVTPPRRRLTEATSNGPPSLGHIPAYILPLRSLKIAELCVGLLTGLKAFLKTGYAVVTYTWADTDPNAHVAVSRRLSRLRIKFPHLLHVEATHCLNSRVPMDIRTISPVIFTNTIPEGMGIILTSPSMMAQHLSRAHKETTLPCQGAPHRLSHLIQYLT